MKYLLILLILFPVSVYAQPDSLLELSLSEMKLRSAGGMNNYAAPLKRYPGLSGTEFYSQHQPLKLKPDYPVLGAVGGVFLGTGIAVHIYQRNAWWKDQRRSFHFVNDNDYALGIDKIGHFYAGSLLAHAFSAGLEAGNIQSEQAAIYGSLASFLFEFYVEIEDGYGPDWGFSLGDLAGDFAGAAFSLGQYYIPFLKNFHPRFSYIPSQKYRDGLHRGNMIDDYEGQKYWIAFRMKQLLPDVVSQYWPSFLMLSAGMGVRDLDGGGGGAREFYIAFDLDAEEIPLYGRGWQFVKNTLNYFHFPMPGIRITPDAAFFVFVF
jgi:hypothetical protein